MRELQCTAADKLHRALHQAGWRVERHAIRPMPDKGLAHDHWWIDSTPAAIVARIPKQSQMNLAAADNLAYQSACFRRAGRSDHTPSLHAMPLPPAAQRVPLQDSDNPWRAPHTGERDAQASGEDWSAALSDDGLIRHVADRVNLYLSLPIVERVIDEWRALSQHPLGHPVRSRLHSPLLTRLQEQST